MRIGRQTCDQSVHCFGVVAGAGQKLCPDLVGAGLGVGRSVRQGGGVGYKVTVIQQVAALVGKGRGQCPLVGILSESARDQQMSAGPGKSAGRRGFDHLDRQAMVRPHQPDEHGFRSLLAGVVGAEAAVDLHRTRVAPRGRGGQTGAARGDNNQKQKSDKPLHLW